MITMQFYEVWVRSSRYHGSSALTYSSTETISVGKLVRVPLQNEVVTGFITTALVAKPHFSVKPITETIALPPLPLQLLTLGRWLQVFYPAPLGQVAQQLTPSISKVAAQETFSYSPPIHDLPPLTAQQTSAIESINRPNTYLLHGTTGSGKTRVYIELAQQALTAGRSAIILTPEISLTSQLTERFRAVFGNRVILLHSGLTPVERRQAWQRCLTAEQALVIIGPRSALFSPLKNIGLIVLDEAHEPAYKQSRPHTTTPVASPVVFDSCMKRSWYLAQPHHL